MYLEQGDVSVGMNRIIKKYIGVSMTYGLPLSCIVKTILGTANWLRTLNLIHMIIGWLP